VNITEVKVTVIENEMRLKASANIVFDDCFLVKGLKIISGSQCLFVQCPAQVKKRSSRILFILLSEHVDDRGKSDHAYEENSKTWFSSSDNSDACPQCYFQAADGSGVVTIVPNLNHFLFIMFKQTKLFPSQNHGNF
jgi:hypothetical protein